VGDPVQVIDGKNKGKQAVIKHLYRYFAFIYSKEVFDNSGIFVEKTLNLTLLDTNKFYSPTESKITSDFKAIDNMLKVKFNFINSYLKNWLTVTITICSTNVNVNAEFLSIRCPSLCIKHFHANSSII